MPRDVKPLSSSAVLTGAGGGLELSTGAGITGEGVEVTGCDKRARPSTGMPEDTIGV